MGGSKKRGARSSLPSKRKTEKIPQVQIRVSKRRGEGLREKRKKSQTVQETRPKKRRQLFSPGGKKFSYKVTVYARKKNPRTKS